MCCTKSYDRDHRKAAEVGRCRETGSSSSELKACMVKADQKVSGEAERQRAEVKEVPRQVCVRWALSAP